MHGRSIFLVGTDLWHGIEEVEGWRQRHALKHLFPLLPTEASGKAPNNGIRDKIALQAAVAEKASFPKALHRNAVLFMPQFC